MSKNIILRCDFFGGSGIGHLKRTSILSSALQKKGYETILLVDNIPPKNIFNLKINYKKLPFENFDELLEAEFIVKLAGLNNVEIIIGDSYRITKKWVQRLKNNGLKVVLLDDFNVDLEANLFINYTPFNKFSYLYNSCRQLRGPKYFLTDSKIHKGKEIYPKRIIAHAGGNGDFSKAKNIYMNLAKITDQLGIQVDWICPSTSSMNTLEKFIKFNDNDQVLTWRKDSRKLWRNYQIVVGPASTSLYEAIIQGALPISFAISKTQCTELNDWLSLGHGLHINNAEKENSQFINLIFELAINKYKDFLNILQDHSENLDANGVKRVIYSVESLLSNSRNRFLEKETKFVKKGVIKCTFEDSHSFLLARNSELVRNISTNANHIISWPEHLKWWLDTQIEKYLFIENFNYPEAYFWVKKWEISNRGYLTAGWFPSSEKTPFTSILKILDWQIKYYSKRYANYTWVATVKKNNKAAIAINKRVGFVEAGNDIYNVLPILFPGTNNDFKVFELKL
tara:strand:+ start:1131 stop:2663 length:1533 start_codon:yes stop_codon:yes gene_type:complete